MTTDTNDLRETVAREIQKADPDYGDMSWSNVNDRMQRQYIDQADAAIAALAPTLPVIPEGWKLRQIVPLLDVRDGKPWIGFAATIGNGPDTATGEAVEWLDALTAAIQAAKGVEP